jgi:hypothetical protein
MEKRVEKNVKYNQKKIMIDAGGGHACAPTHTNKQTNKHKPLHKYMLQKHGP